MRQLSEVNATKLCRQEQWASSSDTERQEEPQGEIVLHLVELNRFPEVKGTEMERKRSFNIDSLW